MLIFLIHTRTTAIITGIAFMVPTKYIKLDCAPLFSNLYIIFPTHDWKATHSTNICPFMNGQYLYARRRKVIETFLTLGDKPCMCRAEPLKFRHGSRVVYNPEQVPSIPNLL